MHCHSHSVKSKFELDRLSGNSLQIDGNSFEFSDKQKPVENPASDI